LEGTSGQFDPREKAASHGGDESAGETFCRCFSAVAESVLGCRAELALLARDSMSSAGFLASVKEPTCCFALRRPGEADGPASRPPAFLELTPRAALAIVERMLGGAGPAGSLPPRPLTDIEQALIRRLAGAVAASLPPRPAGPEARETSDSAGSEPTPAPVPPGDSVVVLTCHFLMPGLAETLRLCLPADAAGPPVGPARGTGRSLVEVSVEVEDPAGLEIPAGQSLNLAPGDIVATELPADGEVVVRVAGIPTFLGRIRFADGKPIVTITRRIGQDRDEAPRDESAAAPAQADPDELGDGGPGGELDPRRETELQ